MSLYLDIPVEEDEELRKCKEEFKRIYNEIVGTKEDVCIECMDYLPILARKEMAANLTSDPKKQAKAACRIAIFILKTQILGQRDDKVVDDLVKITGLSKDEIIKRTGMTEEKIKQLSKK